MESALDAPKMPPPRPEPAVLVQRAEVKIYATDGNRERQAAKLVTGALAWESARERDKATADLLGLAAYDSQRHTNSAAE